MQEDGSRSRLVHREMKSLQMLATGEGYLGCTLLMCKDQGC